MQSSSDKQADESLDFLSPQFDPVKALTSSPSKIQLPCPDIQPCDNLEMYGQVLRGARRVYTGPKVEPTNTPPTTPTPRPRPKEPKYYSRSVVAFMRRSDTGPFKLLQDCMNSACPVRVWTRHCVGVRGVCEGVPLVFDKHMNLVLQNVTEYYQPFRTLGNGGLDGNKKKKKKKQKLDSNPTETSSHVTSAGCHVTSTGCHVTRGCYQMIEHLESFQTRKLSRLFVRGDNVILISPIR